MSFGMRLKTALLISAMLVTACAPTGPASCAGWKPIRLDAASIDGLTSRDAEAILAHNLYGREACGW